MWRITSDFLVKRSNILFGTAMYLAQGYHICHGWLGQIATLFSFDDTVPDSLEPGH